MEISSLVMENEINFYIFNRKSYGTERFKVESHGKEDHVLLIDKITISVAYSLNAPCSFQELQSIYVLQDIMNKDYVEYIKLMVEFIDNPEVAYLDTLPF